MSLIPIFRAGLGLGLGYLVVPYAYAWQTFVDGQSLLIRRCVVCFLRVLFSCIFDMYYPSLSSPLFLLLL